MAQWRKSTLRRYIVDINYDSVYKKSVAVMATDAFEAVGKSKAEYSKFHTTGLGQYAYSFIARIEEETKKQRKIRETKEKMEELRKQLDELEKTL